MILADRVEPPDGPISRDGEGELPSDLPHDDGAAAPHRGGGAPREKKERKVDWDAFNGWPAMPTMVTRAEAASGLRKARRLGRVLVEGSHRYRLIGSNTVILRPR